jgi:hypothetical protein
MSKQRSMWLAIIISSMVLLVGLAMSPWSGVRANDLSSGSATTLAEGTTVLAHTAGITFTPAYTAYLPSIVNFQPQPLAGIYGRVTYQGAPIDNVEIRLLLWTHYAGGWASSSGDTLYTSAQAGGHYQFTTARSLDSNQKYTVKFQNTANDTRFLASWQSTSVYTYTAGQVLPGGDFEIAEMAYLSPANGANVGLPVTFQWQPRVGASTDTYLLELFKPNESLLFRTPRLGYIGSYTLNSLPTGFTTGVQYGWYVWIYGPGDSYGFTNQYGWVTFH